MGFKFEQIDDVTLLIAIDGEFDTILAKELQTELEKYKNKGLEKITFDLAETTHIASSGLRVMIFARERLGKQTHVTVLNAKNIVLEVFKMSGINHFIDVVESPADSTDETGSEGTTEEKADS